LQYLKVQLEKAGEWLGVLHECGTGLTALHLRDCQTEDLAAAYAATAALPDLRCLRLEGFSGVQGEAVIETPFPILQHASKLTQLSLIEGAGDPGVVTISKLSALVNLEVLRLHNIPCSGVPGGFPAQLSKLTCLDVWYTSTCDLAEQFQHLSTFTALQELAVDCRSSEEEHVSAESAAAFV
jgi:hypothetical protein